MVWIYQAGYGAIRLLSHRLAIDSNDGSGVAIDVDCSESQTWPRPLPATFSLAARNGSGVRRWTNHRRVPSWPDLLSSNHVPSTSSGILLLQRRHSKRRPSIRPAEMSHRWAMVTWRDSSAVSTHCRQSLPKIRPCDSAELEATSPQPFRLPNRAVPPSANLPLSLKVLFDSCSSILTDSISCTSSLHSTPSLISHLATTSHSLDATLD
jgi:hypothetical protein